MLRKILIVAGLPILLCFVSCGGKQEACEPATITLERDIGVWAPEDASVQIPTGTYQVSKTASDGFHMVCTESGTEMALYAQELKHQEDLDEMVAFLATGEDGTPHLMVLCDDGIALDAVCNFDDTATRAIRTSRPKTIAAPRLRSEYINWRAKSDPNIQEQMERKKRKK